MLPPFCVLNQKPFTFLKELSSSLREEGKSLLSSFIFDISMQYPPPVSQWLFLDLQRNRTYLFCAIDLFHNGSQIKYSSVLILISLSILATTSKFQKNICFKMRAVGLININATECKGKVAICESGLFPCPYTEGKTFKTNPSNLSWSEFG